jgi:hypothetical protein
MSTPVSVQSSATKIAINALAGRNLLRLGLSWDEFSQLTEQANIGRSIWLSPTSIVGIGISGIKGPRSRAREVASRILRREVGGSSKFDLIRFCALKPIPHETRRTYRFIQDVIGENKPYWETALFQQVMDGRSIMRSTPYGDLLIDDAEKFARYYEQCLALADSIRRRG